VVVLERHEPRGPASASSALPSKSGDVLLDPRVGAGGDRLVADQVGHRARPVGRVVDPGVEHVGDGDAAAGHDRPVAFTLVGTAAERW
jgi:hypothetical protein